MSGIKIGPAELNRISSRINQINNDFNVTTEEIKNACKSLEEKVKTKELTQSLQTVYRTCTGMMNLIYQDLEYCSKFLDKKAMTYGTIDQDLSKNLSEAEDMIDLITFD